MIITIAHPALGPQKTYTTAQVLANALISSVENNDDFTSGDLVLFGEYGTEKCDVVSLTGITGNSTLNHATGPVFSYSARTPIQQLLFNQAAIYRADSQEGTYSLLTTTGLNVDESVTAYNDVGGTASNWYKVRYKNSVTGVFSDYSDEVQGTGYTNQSLHSMADEILEDFGDAEGNDLSRGQVKNYLNSAARVVIREIIKTYPDFRTNYTTQDLVSSTQTYALPDNFLAFKRVDVNLSGTVATNAYKARFESEASGQPNTAYQKTSPRIFIRGTKFGIRPTPTTTGRAFVWYWDYPSAMSNETDEHGLPYSSREVLVAYALWRAWLSKDSSKATRYKSFYKEMLGGLMEFVGQQRQMMWKPRTEIVFGADLYSST